MGWRQREHGGWRWHWRRGATTGRCDDHLYGHAVVRLLDEVIAVVSQLVAVFIVVVFVSVWIDVLRSPNCDRLKEAVDEGDAIGGVSERVCHLGDELVNLFGV